MFFSSLAYQGLRRCVTLHASTLRERQKKSFKKYTNTTTVDLHYNYSSKLFGNGKNDLHMFGTRGSLVRDILTPTWLFLFFVLRWMLVPLSGAFSGGRATKNTQSWTVIINIQQTHSLTVALLGLLCLHAVPLWCKYYLSSAHVFNKCLAEGTLKAVNLKVEAFPHKHKTDASHFNIFFSLKAGEITSQAYLMYRIYTIIIDVIII